MDISSLLNASNPIGTAVQAYAQHREAQMSRGWQEYMSNSAHQREVNDLRAAGLNPILSAGGSGSSTPSGATAQMPDVGRSFQAARMTQAELDALKAAADRDYSSAAAARETAELTREQTTKSVLEQDNLRRQNDILTYNTITAAHDANTAAELTQIRRLEKLGLSAALPKKSTFGHLWSAADTALRTNFDPKKPFDVFRRPTKPLNRNKNYLEKLGLDQGRPVSGRNQWSGKIKFKSKGGSK